MLGFAVTGLADPARLWRKSGLRPGEALVLTKPLGTGIVLAAQMRGRAKARWLVAAIDSMRRTNGDAAAILRAHGVAACTDVTGFGLAGHLTEMLRASGVAAEIDPDAVPALDGARTLAAQGIESTLAPANRAVLPDCPARTPRCCSIRKRRAACLRAWPSRRPRAASPRSALSGSRQR